MYVKIGVSGPYINITRYEFFEVDDDFMELSENQRQREIDEMVQDAIANYIDVWDEICDGSFEDDEDY